MTTLRPIVDFQLAPPPTWASVPVATQDDDWPVEVAERLCDDGPARTTLATRILAAHHDMIGPDPHVLLAVWVPDRAIPEALGILTVDWLLPEPDAVLDRPYYRELIARVPRPRVTLLAQRVADIDVPAGPAVRERERISRPAGGRFSRREIVQENVMYTVFPPGSSDALRLTFTTAALDRADDMAEDADVTLVTLEILLGEPGATT